MIKKQKLTSKKARKVVGTGNPARVLSYKLNVRSRHPSHLQLKRAGIRLPFRTVVRFGSTYLGDGRPRVECNSVDAIKTSASKLLMKHAFMAIGVITADWYTTNGTTMIRKNGQETIMNLPELPYPIVAKHIFGSRGTGNYLIKSQAELTTWLQDKTPTNYIFEKFYNYTREYRLHVTKDGCFYTCRKMLKEGTPDNKRWYRNDSNSVWIVEDNPHFDKPVNWNAIVAESVKALSSVGLDIGAIDVKVQSAKKENGQVRENPKFIILETNSAPSFGDITFLKYKEAVVKVLKDKKAQE
jgi:hypothetical protein